MLVGSHSWKVARPGVVHFHNLAITNAETDRRVSLQIRVWQKLEGKRPLRMARGDTLAWAPLRLLVPSDLPLRLNFAPGEGHIINPSFCWPPGYEKDLSDVAGGVIGEEIELEVIDHLSGESKRQRISDWTLDRERRLGRA